MPQDFARPEGQLATPNASQRERGERRMIRPPALFLAGGALLVLFVLLLAGEGEKVDASVPEMQVEWLDSERATLDTDDGRRERSIVLQPGDAAATALVKLDFDFSDISRMEAACRGVHKLSSVRAGNTFKRLDTPDGTHVYYHIDAVQQLHLSLKHGSDQWQAALEERGYMVRQRVVSGSIEESLFVAAAKAGMDDRTTMNMVDIFSWDIDFARDMRTGDHFTVFYEERFDELGEQIGSIIHAAEFVNQGNSYRAVLRVLADGREEYFTPEGRSMRKTYLKSPVKYSRISSRFSTSRKHPVLGYTRAHRGVDYAAPSGTPIRAIGDGYVSFAGWKGGYGRYVEIKHNNAAHSTAYAHMRSYGRGIRKGVRVKQGQIIGYVGESGLATGPHLHFEFRSRGRAVNPLTVRHEPAKPVPPEEMAAFRAEAERLVQRLAVSENEERWG